MKSIVRLAANSAANWVRPAAFALVLSILLATPIAHARSHGGGFDYHCVPSFGEQKLLGMKCTEIKSASVLYRAGVQNGDIVTSIDGKPTLSPRDMMASMKDLKEADHAQLKVIRAGKEQVLNYVR